MLKKYPLFFGVEYVLRKTLCQWDFWPCEKDSHRRVPHFSAFFAGNGDLHFITASCYHRQPLLGSSRRRDFPKEYL
jgi:hypothetical protein